jgi:phospholipase/carboxylesterase
MTRNDLSLRHLYLPPRRESGGRPPLLILLHGFGSNEHDLFGLHPYLDERFAIVSARAPLTMQTGAYAWYRIEFLGDGVIRMDEAEALRGIAAVTQFVEECIAAYDVDRRRVFVAGFSQGAIMSECLALTRPEWFAGAVLMSGRTLDLLGARVATAPPPYPPMLVVHGVADRVLPIAEGRRTRDFLTHLGVDFEYHEYPMAHQIDDQSLDDVDSWLTARLDELEH